MRKYMVCSGLEGSEMSESLFDSEEDARRAFDGADIEREWRTEWMCLPTGGRGRLKRRRMVKELWAVEVDDDGFDFVGDAIGMESYGYEEFSAEQG